MSAFYCFVFPDLMFVFFEKWKSVLYELKYSLPKDSGKNVTAKLREFKMLVENLKKFSRIQWQNQDLSWRMLPRKRYKTIGGYVIFATCEREIYLRVNVSINFDQIKV